MKDNYIDKISVLVSLIEENIQKDLDLDMLANKTGLSKYYIHRIFKSLTGQSLMSYVRGRKLSLSLNELINTDLNIIDIAAEYRFSHEQSYIRAFKQQFNITPAQYRRVHCEMPVVEKLDIAMLSCDDNSFVVAPRMCIMPQFYLQGIEREIIHDHNYYHQDTNRLVDELEKVHLNKIVNPIDTSVYFGLVMYNANPKGRLYAACTQVKARAPAQEPIKNYTIPTHNYAVFRYVGMHSPRELNFRILLSLYEKINAWKLETDYTQAGAYHIERIDLKNCSPEYCEMDIYVPVTSKPESGNK